MAENVYRYCQRCHAELKTREQVRGLCANCRRSPRSEHTVMCMECGTSGIPDNPVAIAAHDDVCPALAARPAPAKEQ
jgi:hypothetical protein